MIQLPGYQPSTTSRPLQGISGEAAAAPARALQSVANGIGAIGNAAGQIAIDLSRLDNARKLSESRQTLAQNYSQFQIDLQSETDPQARLDKTQKFIDGQRTALFDPDHAPVVKQALDTHISAFASSASITAAQDAANLTTRRATLAFKNELEDATRSNNREQFDTALETASSALGLVPEEIEGMRQDFDRNSQYLSQQLQAEDSPLDAIEALESAAFLEYNTDLYPEDRDRLLKFANQQLQFKRGEQLELLEEAAATGNLSKKDIEAAEFLTPKDARAFANILKESSPPSQQEYLQAWKLTTTLREARSNPAVSDDDYRLMHNDTRATILNSIPPNLQGDLKKELGYTSPAGRNATSPATGSDRKDLIASGSAQINRAYDANFWGDTSKDAPYATKEKAAQNAEDARREMINYVNSKTPLPTITELRQFVYDQNGQSLDDSEPLISVEPNFSIDTNQLREFLKLPGTGPNVPPEYDLLPPKE